LKLKVLEQEKAYCRLQVEVAWDQIAADYDDIVAAYARVPVRGFRAGKTPRHLVDKRFRRQITDDLTRLSAGRFGREAVSQAGMQAAGPLEVHEMTCEKGRPLQFTLKFLPLPEFDLPDLGSIRISENSEDPLGELSQWLLERVSITLPNELVRNELSVDGLDKAKPGTALWDAAAQRVKLMLILKALAARDGIAVDEADVENRITEKAAEFGTTPGKLKSQLEKGGGRERLRDMLIAESTLGYLQDIVFNE